MRALHRRVRGGSGFCPFPSFETCADRRGGGTAGLGETAGAGGLEADRCTCAGTGGARDEFEFRRSSDLAVVDVGRGGGKSSGICSPGLVLRRPRQRLVLGGSGLIFFPLRAFAAGCTNSTPGTSVRLGVITPGFSCCDATSFTLRVDDDAGSRCMPSRRMALGLRW